MPRKKTYLGDGAYAQADNYGGITLTTEDGVKTTNVIYLEPQVLANLVAFARELGYKL